MVINDNLIVGKKGEILPKKRLRDVAGLIPGDKVCVEALPGKIIIRKIYTVDGLFNRPKLGKLTVDQLEHELSQESATQEESSVKNLNNHLR